MSDKMKFFSSWLKSRNMCGSILIGTTIIELLDDFENDYLNKKFMGLNESAPEKITNKDQREIVMIPFTDAFVPPQDGSYLVRRHTTVSKDFQRITHMSATISKYKDPEGNELYTIDVDNRKITHISKEPLS